MTLLLWVGAGFITGWLAGIVTTLAAIYWVARDIPYYPLGFEERQPQ